MVSQGKESIKRCLLTHLIFGSLGVWSTCHIFLHIKSLLCRVPEYDTHQARYYFPALGDILFSSVGRALAL